MSRSKRLKRALTNPRVAALAATALGALAVAAPAQAALTGVSPTLDASGFPTWYQDATNLQLTTCDTAVASCANAVGAGGPVYFDAKASNAGPLIAAGPARAGKISFDALVGGAPGTVGLGGGVASTASTPITENKVVFTATGLQPNSVYHVTDPYGSFDIPTDATGAAAGGRARVIASASCLLALNPATNAPFPCNFAAALAGPVSTFVRQDPRQTAPPAGFIGDSLTPSPIVGSPTGNDFLRIEGPNVGGLGVNSLTETNFIVTGQVNGALTPLVDVAPATDLGSHTTGTSATQSITVSNDSTVDAAISGIALTGANAAEFAIAPGGTCPASGTLPAAAQCTVDVTFAPTAAGAKSAALAVATNAPGVRTSALSASAVAPPALAVTAPAQPQSGAPAAGTLRVAKVRVARRIALRSARRSGITVSLNVPRGAKLVELRLVRAGRTVSRTDVRVSRAGRLSVRVPASRSQRARLARGSYRLEVATGKSRASLGPAASSRIVIG
jgi:Abnormal spindle-like microcephaly-assoc'd, ASPM-SPD-2-Hydin